MGKIFELSECDGIMHAARLNENWNVLLKFLQEETIEREIKVKDCTLLSLIQNSEIQAYFLFLDAFIFWIHLKFNASFQTEEIKVHLLQSAAENLLKTVLKNVVKYNY